MNTIALAIACAAGLYGASCATIEIVDNCAAPDKPSIWERPRLLRPPADGGVD